MVEVANCRCVCDDIVASPSSPLRTGLQIILVVLVVVCVIMGLWLAWRKLKGGENHKVPKMRERGC